jgi:hypothetical protein
MYTQHLHAVSKENRQENAKKRHPPRFNLHTNKIGQPFLSLKTPVPFSIICRFSADLPRPPPHIRTVPTWLNSIPSPPRARPSVPASPHAPRDSAGLNSKPGPAPRSAARDRLPSRALPAPVASHARTDKTKKGDPPNRGRPSLSLDGSGQSVAPNGPRWCFAERGSSRSYFEHPKRQIAPFRATDGHDLSRSIPGRGG